MQSQDCLRWESPALQAGEDVNSPHLKTGIQMGSLYACEPRRNTPEGLQLAAALEHRDVNFSMSTFLLDRLAMHRLYVAPHPAGREFGFVKYAARASVSPDETRILVAIPGDRKKSAASISAFPPIPEWMREIGMETYFEVQGR